MITKAQLAATKRYQNKAYASLNIRIPKALNEKLEEKIKQEGVSKRQFIISLIEKSV